MALDYRFYSEMEPGYRLSGTYTEADIKVEPQLFNCDVKYAMHVGGKITLDFLHTIDVSYPGLIHRKRVIIDSRVHMLMPGWYPCIPGWHHDDVPRKGPFGQPDYDTPAYRADHCMALVNGDVAPTEFALGEAIFPKIPDGIGPVYKHYDKIVNDLLDADKLLRYQAPSNQLIWFDWQTWHQGVPAVKFGWRWFGRLSYETDRVPTNEIRTQTQVYLPVPKEGW
jgi:hypothetical protein